MEDIIVCAYVCVCICVLQVLNAFLQIIANQAARAVEPGLLLELINVLDRWVTDPYPGQEVGWTLNPTTHCCYGP